MIKNLDHSAQKDSETSERMNTSPNKRVIASFERLEEFQMEEGFFLFMKLQRIIFFKDNNSDDEKLNPRRKYNSKTLLPNCATPLIDPLITKSCSTRFDDEDFKDGKELRFFGKFKTFVDLRNNKKLSVETKSMLQISDVGAQFQISQSQNSYNSLTSIEGLFYKNPVENDFEDEELSLEFRTMEYVGQGFHAVVKKVQNIVTNEIYAAKITRINDEEIALAITNEFEILKKLDHPYILKAYRLIRNPSKCLMTMISEYVDCKNLTSYISKNGKNITETKALQILKKLLTAVHYLHCNQICHRDISPQNILASDDLSLFKLVDFGVSKVFNAGNIIIDMITPTGIPAYRAPEIFKGYKFDEKIDEWNCGHIFYELLMGKHLTSKKLYKMIKDKEMVKNLEDFSFAAKEILVRLLDLNPKKRVSAADCLKLPIFTEV